MSSAARRCRAVPGWLVRLWAARVALLAAGSDTVARSIVLPRISAPNDASLPHRRAAPYHPFGKTPRLSARPAANARNLFRRGPRSMSAAPARNPRPTCFGAPTIFQVACNFPGCQVAMRQTPSSRDGFDRQPTIPRYLTDLTNRLDESILAPNEGGVRTPSTAFAVKHRVKGDEHGLRAARHASRREIPHAFVSPDALNQTKESTHVNSA